MDFKLASGAKLSVTEAPFVDAMALQKALLASVRGVPLAQDIMKMDVSVLKDAVISAAISPEVESAVFRCADRATYDNIRVSEDLLNDPKIGTRAREDFYEIAWNIIVVNCGPFFKRTFSRLKAALPATPDAPQK